MSRSLSAGQWTLALSATLGVGAAGLSLGLPSNAILQLGMSQKAVIPMLIGMFLLAELFLMNVEFRRQAHSLTLAGVPLVLGVLLLPTHLLSSPGWPARDRLHLQRINPVKMLLQHRRLRVEAALDATCCGCCSAAQRAGHVDGRHRACW